MSIWPSMERNQVVSVWMSSHVHKAAPLTPEETRRIEERVANFQYATIRDDAEGNNVREEAGKQGKAEPAKKAASGAGAIAYDNGPSTSTPATNTTTCTAPDACNHATSATESSATSLPCSAAELLASRRKLNTPWYEVPIVPQLNGATSGALPAGMRYHGYTENTVDAVIFEIPENGSDVAHLPELHGEFVIPSLTWLLSHKWAATWKGSASSPRSHIADITVTENIALLDKFLLPGEVQVTITQVGMSQVYLRMITPVGPITIVETVTPVAPMKLRVLHGLFAPNYVPAILAKLILWVTLVQFEKDVPIWCNKRYEKRPCLSAADPCIPMYRRWTAQFQTPEAITFAEAAKAHVKDLLGLPGDVRLDW